MISESDSLPLLTSCFGSANKNSGAKYDGDIMTAILGLFGEAQLVYVLGLSWQTSSFNLSKSLQLTANPCFVKL